MVKYYTKVSGRFSRVKTLCGWKNRYAMSGETQHSDTRLNIA